MQFERDLTQPKKFGMLNGPPVRAASEPKAYLRRPGAYRAMASGAPANFGYWQARTVGGALKRAFDVASSGIAIVALAPILLTLTLLVWLEDRGSPFYAHKRIGRGGRTFGCLKFRTMVLDSDRALAEHLKRDEKARMEWARTRKLRDDPRVTTIGKVLRATSLDELPQLLNIFKGDMSVVGPRPIVVEEFDEYQLNCVHYMSARPGLTGLWQVSGRSDASYQKRVAFDRDYVLNWSLMRDFLIIAKTVPAVLYQRGGY